VAEFTIVGAGLAGTTLAWTLHRRGRTVRLIDREPPTTTSRVAAGLLTPITGKKPAVSWRWAEFRAAAELFYQRAETETGERFFHPRPVVRVFTSDQEREAFRRPEFAGLVEPAADAVVMTTAAQLDVATYLDASRECFRQRVVYECGEWDGQVNGVTVLCQGYTPDGPFPLPYRAAKGEVLSVRVPGLDAERVLNRRGVWLAPAGREGLFRFGATYSWDRLDAVPTPDGRAELETKLREMLTVPFEVVGHAAGVRPIVAGQKPVLGMHPTIPNMGVFNGLGSKGSLSAPYFAEMLASHLCDGAPIEQDVDVRHRLGTTL
jgi:glycine/D-amino acid oxidase-like deaminating enzyme